MNKLPDAFNDVANVTKSHVPAMNVPARINISVEQSQNIAAKESAIRQKRGRPIGSKDSASRKMKNEQSSSCPPKEVHNPPKEVPPEEARNAPEKVMIKSVLSRIMEIPDETLEAPEEAPVPDNEEISILYNYLIEKRNRNEIVIDDVFTNAVATQISKENNDDDWDTKPRTINEC